jgi:helix-turn-helix protein
MSIEALTAVWQHSKHSGSALLVELAIADFSHDDGGGAYPSIATLMKKARLSERSTHRAIAKVVKSGEMSVQPGAGPRGVNLYAIKLELLRRRGVNLAPGVPSTAERGANSDVEGVSPVAPDPLSDPSLNLKSGQHPPNSSSRKGRKRTIPNDFILTPDRRAKIIAAGHREDCSDLDPEAFFAHFSEKCRAEGYSYSNWDRALVEWSRREGPKSPYRATAQFADSRPQREVKDAIAESFHMTRAEYDEFMKRDRAGQISKEDRRLLLDGKISIFALESQIEQARI